MEKKPKSVGKKKKVVKKKGISKKGKKKIFAAMDKNQKYAVGMIAIVAIAGIGSGIAIFASIPKGGEFIYGVVGGPLTIDPLDAWEANSIDIINQVAEGLFDYDLTSEDNKIIHNLATDHFWNNNATELTCILRQGVSFHDGTVFNATTAKWNFDRIQSMLPEMNSGSLWILPDGVPIINKTIVVDTYTLRLELNDAYVPLLGLLSSWTAYMLSPTSTPTDRFIEFTEVLVGTGPFTLDSCDPLVEIKMLPNPSYWGGKPAIDELIFSIIDDVYARNEAMLSGDVSMIRSPLSSYLSNFSADPMITVQEGPPSTQIWYLMMNNNLIPVEIRKAISYAINYSYLIDEIMSDTVIRMRSPIPKGIFYSNTKDFEVPGYDIQIARQALKDAGWLGTENLTANDDISPGNEWGKLITDGTPLAKYNNTYPLDAYNPTIDAWMILVTENLKQIGIEIETVGLSTNDIFFRMYEYHGLHRDMLHLYTISWQPDYNDPSSFINPLFTNKTVASNAAQVNDTQVQQWMEEALSETDPIAREQLYYNIQKRLIEEVYPWCWLYVQKNIDVYISNLRGWQASSLKDVFKTVYFV